MKQKRIGIVTVLVMLLSTCKSDLYNPDVCFQEDVLPIFVSKCSMSGCHSSTSKEEGFDLTNYDGIMKGIVPKHPFQSEIYNQIRGNNPSMPVGQKLSTKELSYIKIWIKMGAKNSSNCNDCDTSQYTFNGRIKPLLDAWCIRCHSGYNVEGGYDFSSYAGTVAAITDNKLIQTIKHLPGYMPMPAGTARLSDCDINAIQRWIDVNYPNN